MSVRREAIVLASGFALVGIGLAMALGSTDPGGARGALRWIVPRSLELTFLLLLASFVLSLPAIRETLPRCRYRDVLAVGLLAFLAVRFLPPSTHRIYYDEDIYENVAQNIVWTGKAQMCNEGLLSSGTFSCEAWEYNKEPNGFPFLLSLGFRLTGVSESTAHLVNHLVFAFGAMSLYWLGGLLFGSSTAALGAASVFVLVPQNLLWGGTVAAEPSAAVFAAFGLGAWLLFLRRLTWPTGLLAGSALAFAAQFRPESGLVLVVAGLAVLLLAPDRLRRPELYRAALLVLVLMLPMLVHIWSVRNESWGAVQGAKFSMDHVVPNAKTNLLYLVSGEDFPRLFTLLALVGLAWSSRRRETLWTVLWFAAFFGIFIPFYAGSYRYGADVRFAFVSSTPLALLAGAGIAVLSESLARRVAPRFAAAAPFLSVLWAFGSYLPFVRAVGDEAWSPRADHDAFVAMLADIPEDSIVLSHNPGMVQVLGRSAAQASHATYQPERVDGYFRRFAGGVYFHYNFWCNTSDPVQNEFCTNVLSRYRTRLVRERSARFHRYVLYRLLPNVPPP